MRVSARVSYLVRGGRENEEGGWIGPLPGRIFGGGGLQGKKGRKQLSYEVRERFLSQESDHSKGCA